jgi:hypothetical protein
LSQVPKTISYQGLLTDQTGRAVTDGNYSLTFKLYDALTSGNLLWSETQSNVAVSRGIASTVLGSVQTINLSFNTQYWLGVTIGSGSELTPRTSLTSAPYSFIAASVRGTSGVTVNNISNDTTLAGNSASSAVTEKAAKSYIDTHSPPIGSVTAWLKSYPNTPALPNGWVECNGQTLNDAASPYNGQVIPALNGTTESTKLFLRGSVTSGGAGGQATNSPATHNETNAGGAGYDKWYGGAMSIIPPYYEVVWILRVK